MSKYKLLSLVNISLATFFIFTLATSKYSNASLISFTSFIHDYAVTGVFLFFIFMNVFITYKLLFKKDKLPFYLYVILTLATVFWFFMLFIGYFFASNVLFPIVSIVLVISIFYFFSKSSRKLATMLSLITLLMALVVFISGFEEDYCWRKGTAADTTGSKMIIATKEDAEALQGFNVKEGTQIGVGFRVHMLCHSTFNFIDAVKESYFFAK